MKILWKKISQDYKTEIGLAAALGAAVAGTGAAQALHADMSAPPSVSGTAHPSPRPMRSVMRDGITDFEPFKPSM